MYLEKQNGHSVLVQAIFFLVFFFPGTGGVVFTILDVVEAGRYMCQWCRATTPCLPLRLGIWVAD